MKKKFIGMLILSLMFALNMQIVQAKGNNGKVGAKQQSTVATKKHPNARLNKGVAQGNSVNVNAGSNKRLEGKEKAMQNRNNNNLSGNNRGHKGHGKRKNNLNNLANSNIQPRHTNRAKINNSQANVGNSLKQQKNKKYIKQNGTRNKPARIKK